MPKNAARGESSKQSHEDADASESEGSLDETILSESVQEEKRSDRVGQSLPVLSSCINGRFLYNAGNSTTANCQ